VTNQGLVRFWYTVVLCYPALCACRPSVFHLVCILQSQSQEGNGAVHIGVCLPGKENFLDTKAAPYELASFPGSCAWAPAHAQEPE